MNFRREMYRCYCGRMLRIMLQPLGLFEWSAVYKKDLTEPIEIYEARVPIEISLASEAELPEISKATPYHLINLLRARFNAGSKCLVAKIDGRIVGFNWYVYGPVYDEGYRIELGRGDIYCMDAMTYEPYRGYAIHTELLSHLLINARQAGFKRAFTRVSVMNMPSWKTHMRLGWQPTGSTFLLHTRAVFGSRVLSWPELYPLVHAPFEAAQAAKSENPHFG